MKRWFALILLCFVLAGCGAQPQENTTEVTHDPEPEAQTQPTEPTGCYDPESSVEKESDGAVKAYPLGIPDAYGFLSMDSHVVVFAGQEETQLLRLSGDNYYITAAASLTTRILPEDPSVRVSSQGMTYFDRTTSEMVILDVALKEVRRIRLPDTVIGTPVISEDRMFLYYSTPDALRAVDMETGIHKLLVEMAYETQSVTGVWCGGAVLECAITESDGRSATLYFSSKDGTLLLERETPIHLVATGERYYCTYPDGTTHKYVFGSAQERQQLRPLEHTQRLWFLEENHTAVAIRQEEEGVAADWYDLSTGLRRSTLFLGEGSVPAYVDFDSASGELLLMRFDAGYGRETIYRWDAAALPSGDNGVYTVPYYSADFPDEAGLAECRKLANEIGQRHGVEILLWEDAVKVQPWDYSMEPEYQVPVIRDCLRQLDALLEAYPAGMLDQAVQGTTQGVLSVCLVRDITGTPESGNQNQVPGIQFWQEEDAYVVLSVGADLNYQLYHELFRILETRIFSECTAFYEWEKLNPEGFEYDYDYAANLSREPGDYLSGENRAFIDTFSMSFSIEDRARIAEYAMNPDNELYFQSDIMQKKLKTICLGIREAFGLTDSTEKFLWEQYLHTPLN